MKIIMLKGISSSGKSSWANEQAKTGNFIVVSKDEIRKMLGGYKTNREKYVLRIRNDLIRSAVKLKKNVIVDDTNLNPIHERTLKQLAKELGCKFEVNDSFLQVSPEECIKRDLHRGENAVGAEVIWSQYYKWVAPNYVLKLNKEFDKPRCVICCIEETLSIGVSDDPFEDKSIIDPFTGCVIDALGIYGTEYNDNKYPNIILISNRELKHRERVLDWLDKNDIAYDRIYFRNEGDERAMSIVKSEIYSNEIYPKYAVLGVMDSDPQSIKMWQKLGLRTANFAQWGKN